MKDVTAKARANGKKKFLYYFPKGFVDAKYYRWERDLNKKEYVR